MKKFVNFRGEDIDNLLVFVFIGVIVGGRIGYIVLYNFTYFVNTPSEIFAIWRGGMSFHGGCIGVILAVLLFSYWKKYNFWEIIDKLAIIVPVAIGLGRIGNYINQELPGYTGYTGPFAMNIEGVSHFPSPLLEMMLEGILLFIIMILSWKIIKKRLHSRGASLLSAIFLIGYSIMRLIGEQFRLPDDHIGYVFGTSWITLGMLYTLPLLVFGFGIILFYMRKVVT